MWRRQKNFSETEIESRKMDSLSAKLGLDLEVFRRKFVSGFLKDMVHAGGGKHLEELEDFVAQLEEERRKVDAFKSELPLCVILLTHVIDVLKLEMEQYRSTCVVEKLISLKAGSIEDDEKKVRLAKLEDSKDKMEWLSSAQLWHNCSDESVILKNDSHLEEKRDAGSDLSKESRNRSPVSSTFLPERMKEEGNLGFSLPELFLLPPAIRASVVSASSEDVPVGGNVSKAVLNTPATAASSSGSGIQLPRKARRSWSPELHRRFTIALQQLGGAQAATPKQIREVMKVDGLTNDEVKSHLQKYRLHTRNLPNYSSSQVNRWASENHCLASQSGSPQGPFQLACSTQAGDSSDEDRRSESYSWKS